MYIDTYDCQTVTREQLEAILQPHLELTDEQRANLTSEPKGVGTLL